MATPDRIRTFTTATTHVGNLPYCAANGQAVWKQHAKEIPAATATVLIETYTDLYSGSTLNSARTDFDADGVCAVVIGARDAWQVFAIRTDMSAVHAIVRCECHAREIAQHLVAIATD